MPFCSRQRQMAGTVQTRTTVKGTIPTFTICPFDQHAMLPRLVEYAKQSNRGKENADSNPFSDTPGSSLTVGMLVTFEMGISSIGSWFFLKLNVICSSVIIMLLSQELFTFFIASSSNPGPPRYLIPLGMFCPKICVDKAREMQRKAETASLTNLFFSASITPPP